MKEILLAVVVVFLAREGLGHPGGAPAATCDSMDPKHGAQAQASQSPYGVHASHSQVAQGGTITVTVYGSVPFRGLLLTARDAQTNQLLSGVFSPSDATTKALHCNVGQSSAITHNSNADKTQSVVQWTAPIGYTGQAYFTATVVQSYSTFWKGVSSASVLVQ